MTINNEGIGARGLHRIGNSSGSYVQATLNDPNLLTVHYNNQDSLLAGGMAGDVTEQGGVERLVNGLKKLGINATADIRRTEPPGEQAYTIDLRQRQTARTDSYVKVSNGNQALSLIAAGKIPGFTAKAPITTEHELMRKYADIIREAQEPKSQLDEGVMDMLKPVAQKLGKWLMSKIDPETAKQLKQAYDQAGGDKDKFMAAIGITKDDVAKIAPQPNKKQPSAQQPQINEWMSASEHPNAPLKVKVLNLLVNGIPLSGILTLLAGGMFNVAIPTAWPAMIWYVVSAAMFWGMGNYEFSDVFGDSGKPQTTASKGVTRREV